MMTLCGEIGNDDNDYNDDQKPRSIWRNQLPSVVDVYVIIRQQAMTDGSFPIRDVCKRSLALWLCYLWRKTGDPSSASPSFS